MGQDGSESHTGEPQRLAGAMGRRGIPRCGAAGFGVTLLCGRAVGLGTRCAGPARQGGWRSVCGDIPSSVNLIKIRDLFSTLAASLKSLLKSDISLSPLQLGHTAQVPKTLRACFFLVFFSFFPSEVLA